MDFKKGIVNGFGALFYMSCLLLWLWACLPFLPLLIDFSESMQTSSTTQTAHPFEVNVPPIIAIITGSVVALLAIAVSLYIMIKTPPTVAKAGHTAVKHATQKITAHPKIQQLPVNRRKKITTRLLLSIKLALCLVPPIICTASVSLTPLELSYPVFLGVAIALSSAALSCLTAQHLTAKLLRVPSSLMW